MPYSIMVWSPRRCLRSCTLWKKSTPLQFLVKDLLVVQLPILLHASLQACEWYVLGLQFLQLAGVSFCQPQPLSGHGHQPFQWSLWWPHPGWTSQLQHLGLTQHSSEHLQQQFRSVGYCQFSQQMVSSTSILETVQHHPFQGQELLFGQMIITLIDGQGSAQICNRVVLPIWLLVQ